MELYLIRHGQSANNLLYGDPAADGTRVEDPELTATGEKQAEALAEYVARELEITHLYTSLMVRAAATADVIGRRIRKRPVAWSDVHECMGIFLENADTGDLEGLSGKPRSFFEKRFPSLELPADLDEAGWWNRPVESRNQWVQRATRFLAELKRRGYAAADRVAVVTHGDFSREIIRQILRIPPGTAIAFQIANTAISAFDFTNGITRVRYLNRTDHLPAELETP